MTTPQQIIERLYQIKENPGIYKSLSAEEQADILLFILTPKPLLKKTATVKLEKGERGLPGIAGTNSLTEAQQTAILTDLVGKIKVQNGKDAVVTTAMLDGIVAEVISRIELPNLEQVVTTTITADPTAIRNSLELLNDEERLKQSAIDNLPEDLQKIRDTIVALPRGGNGIGKNQVYNFIREAVADGTIPAGGGGAVTSVNTRTGAVVGLAENSDLTAHTGSTANPHSVTKAQVGLSAVPNTDFTAAVDANTAKISYTDAAKVAHITVTQAVDLDTMESDTVTNNAKVGITAGQASAITANTAKISFDATSSARLANTSGTNTGDNATNTQYSGLVTNATHTGEVTGSGALTIAANAVTNAKAAQMATKTYKGRTSALTGDSEDVAVATLKTDLVLVKADVGLGSVDNTADTAKPVSTAQQTALNLKANSASPTFTGTVVLPASQIVNGVTLISGGVATEYLSRDGTYNTPAGGGGGGLSQPQIMARLSIGF